MKTVTLFRPVGPKELALIEASEWRCFPPRLPEQPFFVRCSMKTTQPGSHRTGTSRGNGSGYVTRFTVDSDFVSRYPVKIVGSSAHQELWIPAEELDEFNQHIVGRIEVIAKFPEPDQRRRNPLLEPIVTRSIENDIIAIDGVTLYDFDFVAS